MRSSSRWEAACHRLLQLGGDQPVRAPEERLGDAIELLAKPIGGLLANRAHPVLELDCPRLAARVDLASHRALEVVDLPALELCERDLDPCPRFALGAVDLLRHRLLVLSEPVVQLVDGAPAVVGLRGELLERPGQRVAGARLELLAEPDGRGALLVDRRVELVRLGCHSRLDVRDALAHPLLERGDCALERVLRALEVGLPCPQTLFHALLHGGNELGHAIREVALAHGELAAALVREPAFLGDVRRERVGLGARDRDAQLFALCRCLLLGRRPNGAPRLGHELLGSHCSGPRAAERQRQRRAPTRSAAISAARRIQVRVVTSRL